MRLAGEQRVAAPRQKVWEALNDPQVLRQSIPGCQSLDKQAEDRLAAIVEIRIGPIGAPPSSRPVAGFQSCDTLPSR